MRFFTADTHFYNAIFLGDNDFAPRDFPSIEAMHAAIIKNWNDVVGVNDVVYHLGDIADPPTYENGYPDVYALLAQLNGKIIFIKGNHDHRSEINYLMEHDVTQKFEFNDVGVLLKFNRHQFFLTHYPMMLGITKNSINLHGHVHNYALPVAENINVGLDAPERRMLETPIPFGAPISENQIMDIITAKKAEIDKLQRL